MAHTINISEETAKNVRYMAEIKGETFDYMAEKLLQDAIKDKTYRMVRSANKWQQMKAEKARLAELEEKIAQLEK